MKEELSKCLEEAKGTTVAKERLRVVLEVIGGDLEEKEACSLLKICAAEFHEMRERILQEMLNELENL